MSANKWMFIMSIISLMDTCCWFSFDDLITWHNYLVNAINIDLNTEASLHDIGILMKNEQFNKYTFYKVDWTEHDLTKINLDMVNWFDTVRLWWNSNVKVVVIIHLTYGSM